MQQQITQTIMTQMFEKKKKSLPLVINRRRQWHPTPALLPGKSHGRRSLVGCSPQGRKESDTTELLPFHFSLSCIGEENGNPLQCSCLENRRDRGAWWASLYGVAQSRTRLKRLSSSSSSHKYRYIYAVAAAKSLQSCPTLCDPIDGSPPGFPVPGILQARTSPGIFQTRVLEWGAIAFSGYVYEEKINTSMTLVSHIFN